MVIVLIVFGLVVVCCYGFYRFLAHPKVENQEAKFSQRSVAEQTKLGSDLNGSESPPLFELVSPERSRVKFRHRLVEDHPLAYLYNSGYACGGVSLGDVNGDGLCDLLVISGPDQNGLFLNTGALIFKKAVASSRVLSTGDSWGVGANMVDIDGDGDLDVFLCNYDSPNQLFRNDGLDEQGEIRFTEVAKAAGLSFQGPSQFPYFSDFDADGDLDLFLLTNRLYSPFGRPHEVASELGTDGKVKVKDKYSRYFRVVQPRLEAPATGKKLPSPFLLEYGHEDRLYRNDGIGDDGIPRFVDVTRKSGIDNVFGHGLSALIWDVNKDGLPDIYVANDFTDPDKLWINRGLEDDGPFRFEDRIEDYVPYTAWSAMGSDVADVNGDGRLDFMIADMAATTHFKAKSTMGEMSGWRRWVLENGWPRQSMRNMLYVDSGVGRFRETGFIAGVAKSDWTWAVKFADLDLDGRNDLFLTNGSARVFNDSDVIVNPAMMVGRTEWDVFRDKPEMHERNLAFRNQDGLHFEDFSKSWQLDKNGMSYAAATGDLDGDGDLELVVCNLEDDVSIYRNQAADQGNHWLSVRLEGNAKNRLGYGAIVKVVLPDGSKQVRLMNPQTGFLSVNEPVVHFGLGTVHEIRQLTVRWADGSTQDCGSVEADQLLVIQKNAGRNIEQESEPGQSTFRSGSQGNRPELSTPRTTIRRLSARVSASRKIISVRSRARCRRRKPGWSGRCFCRWRCRSGWSPIRTATRSFVRALGAESLVPRPSLRGYGSLVFRCRPRWRSRSFCR